MAVLMVGLGLWVGAGGVQLWQVVLITFLVGCAQVFDVPARQALILDTVPREAAPNGVALNAFAQRAFGAVGAFAGGALIPAIGVSSCYFAVAAVYLLGVVTVLGLRVPRDHHASLRTHPPFRQALVDAARLIVDIPAVRTLSLAGIQGGRGMLAKGRSLSAMKEDTSMEGVAGAALWLLSDLGKSTTGEVVHVDAGFHIMGFSEDEGE